MVRVHGVRQAIGYSLRQCQRDEYVYVMIFIRNNQVMLVIHEESTEESTFLVY